jgi:hypothetical protein
MAKPSTGGETDAAPHSKKPHGHYTARLLIRLPFAGSAAAASIDQAANGCIRMRQYWWPDMAAQGMATGERDR